MAYDFDYFGGKDISYPERFRKPIINSNPSVQDALNFAKELDIYHSKNEKRKLALDNYHNATKQRLEEFKTKLRDDYDLNQKQFDVIWGEAWESGHSYGLSEVYYYFDKFYDMATKFAALEG